MIIIKTEIKWKFTNSFPQALQTMGAKQNKTLEKIGAFVKGKARLLAAVDTGEMRQKMDDEVLKDSVRIGNFSKHGIYVEKGTGIYATSGRGRQTPWVYKDPRTGKFIRTIGQKPQPFLTPAAEDNIKAIKAITSGTYGEINNE